MSDHPLIRATTDRLAPTQLQPQARPAKADGAGSFAAELAAAAGGLRFSKHAVARLERRGIPLDQATVGRLQRGVEAAAAKGARQSVVLVDGTVFVVSVEARTVLTAVPRKAETQVFTNVDSAVLA